MKVRIYYLFKIRPEMYKEGVSNPENIYKILENIYLMSNDDIVLGYKLFDKLCMKVDKHNLNKMIREINSSNECYVNFNNTHIINDFFNDENTKLIINNSHMKIKTDSEYPSFFESVKNIPNLFVCDFINSDYFFLKDIKSCSCV